MFFPKKRTLGRAKYWQTVKVDQKVWSTSPWIQEPLVWVWIYMQDFLLWKVAGKPCDLWDTAQHHIQSSLIAGVMNLSLANSINYGSLIVFWNQNEIFRKEFSRSSGSKIFFLQGMNISRCCSRTRVGNPQSRSRCDLQQHFSLSGAALLL